MKNQITLLVMLISLPLFSTLYADNAGKTLDVTLSIRDGRNDNPMIVIWLENASGDFIKTLHMFSKRQIHYNKLKDWAYESEKAEKPADIDAVSGATIGWGQNCTVSIPAQIGTIDLLNGKYVLRIESRTHFGENYQSLTIPLQEGYTGSRYDDIGAIKSLEVSIKDKTN